ncbi:hypothetical protein HHI36_013319 [Cryptolaemus montrouzieri]|uniref:MATH domain-containing protein n=1 Tax=Cryptolaemus montrouzieri TaxID=559131 RepID=A0ABD2NHX1_9CUCU
MSKPDFVLTFIDATEATLRYRIRGFSEVKGAKFSPPCYVLNIPWKIMIMPRATRDEYMRWSPRYLGYFLQCDGETATNSWSCYVYAELALLGVRSDVEPVRKRIRHIFDSKHNNFGFNFYMLWDDITNPSNGFIEQDTVTVEIHLITEAPKSIGILYDWRDLKGKILVPKSKWSNAVRSLSERNTKLEQERNSLSKEQFLSAVEFQELLNKDDKEIEKHKNYRILGKLVNKIEKEITEEYDKYTDENKEETEEAEENVDDEKENKEDVLEIDDGIQTYDD